MIARVAAIGAVVVLPLMAACSERESFASQPLRERGVGKLEPYAKLSEAPPAQRNDPPQPEVTTPVPEPTPETTAVERPAPVQPEQPVRNLQTELEKMMGNPTSCLKPQAAADAPARVDISLSAKVMPSGAVGRGEVSAPGLTPEEIGCVRARLEALHFAQPIENAPFTVTGSIRLERGS